MRPHRALFHLVLRHTVWKVLLLLLLLAAAQWSAFLCLSPDPASIGLADAFSLSGGALAGLLALAFLLLSALLLLATTGRGARRPGYTLARLPLSPGWVVFWQGVYNTLVYLLFWGVQALVLVGIGWYYGRQGGFLGTQTLYVTGKEIRVFFRLFRKLVIKDSTHYIIHHHTVCATFDGFRHADIETCRHGKL